MIVGSTYVPLIPTAEANSHLKRLQSDSGSLSTENKDLLTKLSDFSCRIEDLQQTQTQLFAENEVLKEKLSDAHVSHAQLTAEVTELSEKHEECSMLWKEAQEEIQTLKAQQPFSSSFVDTDSNSSIAEATTGVGACVICYCGNRWYLCNLLPW